MRLRRTAAVTVALLTLGLSACGEDEAGDSGTDPGSSESSPDSDTDGDTDSDSGSGSGRTPLDSVGSAVESVMQNVQGYSIDGTELRIDLDGGVDAAESDCAIIGTAAGAFELPPGSTIVLVYGDGEAPCAAP